LALFLPIPLSGYGPAIAIFISSLGLVERDGVVLMIGLAVGVLAVVITIVMALLILFGVHSLGAPAPV
ncbi:MAG: exopolysaccharide biosynthesis protein, partial [Limibacillus sp.]